MAEQKKQSSLRGVVVKSDIVDEGGVYSELPGDTEEPLENLGVAPTEETVDAEKPAAANMDIIDNASLQIEKDIEELALNTYEDSDENSETVDTAGNDFVDDFEDEDSFDFVSDHEKSTSENFLADELEKDTGDQPTFVAANEPSTPYLGDHLELSSVTLQDSLLEREMLLDSSLEGPDNEVQPAQISALNKDDKALQQELVRVQGELSQLKQKLAGGGDGESAGAVEDIDAVEDLEDINALDSPVVVPVDVPGLGAESAGVESIGGIDSSDDIAPIDNSIEVDESIAIVSGDGDNVPGIDDSVVDEPDFTAEAAGAVGDEPEGGIVTITDELDDIEGESDAGSENAALEQDGGFIPITNMDLDDINALSGTDDASTSSADALDADPLDADPSSVDVLDADTSDTGAQNADISDVSDAQQADIEEADFDHANDVHENLAAFDGEPEPVSGEDPITHKLDEINTEDDVTDAVDITDEPAAFDDIEDISLSEEPAAPSDAYGGDSGSDVSSNAAAAPEESAFDEPEMLEEPEILDEPVALDEPEAVAEPAALDEPAELDDLETLDEPEALAEPAVLDEPEVPGEPEALAEPAELDDLETLDEPAALDEPETLSEPEMLDEPEALDEVETLGEPEALAEPAGLDDLETLDESAALDEPETLEEPAALDALPADEAPVGNSGAVGAGVAAGGAGAAAAVATASAPSSDSGAAAAGGPAALNTVSTDELRTIIGYMDELLEELPQRKVEEFAHSQYFELYERLFDDLGLKTTE